MSTMTIDKESTGTLIQIINAGKGLADCVGAYGIITNKTNTHGLDERVSGVNVEITEKSVITTANKGEVWRVPTNCVYRVPDTFVTIDKLPVGTKVKIIDAGWGSTGCNGSVGVITTKEAVSGLDKVFSGANVELTNSPYGTGIPEVWRVRTNCKYELISKPNSKQFTKSDLQDGDFVVHKNGDVEVCLIRTGILLCRDGNCVRLEGFDEDLTYSYFDSPGHSLDIVKVYRPKKGQYCCFNNYNIGELVYDREEFDIRKWATEMVKDGMPNYYVNYDKNAGTTIVYELKTLKVGTARCKNTDTFDAEIGVAIAYCRAEGIKIPDEVFKCSK